MKETLRMLYNETSIEIEENTPEESQKCRLIEDMDKCLYNLMDKLDGDEKALLTEFEARHIELLALEKESAFVRGFSLATKILSEALT